MMEKLDPKKDGSSKDIIQGNVQKLKELFPEVFSEDTWQLTEDEPL